ncbi:MAG TPA: multiheme c-type cytochrome [Tepidisphaeraceae bacterium]|jgi:hypothetical protein|nr:multiheme c-type cytochrome [Tepidisphaeraceae bacterium]
MFAAGLIVLGAALGYALGRWPRPQVASETFSESELSRMLVSDDALMRAAACASIGRSHQAQFVVALVPRLSDDDWRVRAAGFEALHDLGQGHIGFTEPLRDTPVEDREHTILDALAQWRANHDLPALPRLCEMYPTLTHWLAGPVIAENCLSCHAPSNETRARSIGCASCHREIHTTWDVSAHSFSVSHLPLARVDPQTKQVVLWNYGTRIGIDCVACHTLARDANNATNISPIQPPLAFSRHRFDRTRPASATCAGCHSDTQAEWETWQSYPRPGRASWPPDTIEWNGPSPTASPIKSCVGCHMQRQPDILGNAPTSSPHGFVTRRNPAFLSDGLAARIEPAFSGASARLLLTNLAGHSYPGGTHRRSLRIEVLFNDDPATRHLVARLKRVDPVPTTQPYQPVLAPGEERGFDLPVRANASSVTCEITYERNGYVDPGYEVLLHRISAQLH